MTNHSQTSSGALLGVVVVVVVEVVVVRLGGLGLAVGGCSGGKPGGGISPPSPGRLLGLVPGGEIRTLTSVFVSMWPSLTLTYRKNGLFSFKHNLKITGVTKNHQFEARYC